MFHSHCEKIKPFPLHSPFEAAVTKANLHKFSLTYERKNQTSLSGRKRLPTSELRRRAGFAIGIECKT